MEGKAAGDDESVRSEVRGAVASAFGADVQVRIYRRDDVLDVVDPAGLGGDLEALEDASVSVYSDLAFAVALD